jgi:hypothetical protein
MPQNAREGIYAWHPRDVDRVWSFGGDWPTKSTDGGRTFVWSGEGQNAVFVGGQFNFNPHHPGLLLLTSQDYNGGVTRDGGRTWNYVNISGLGWGGFTYGGLALSPGVLAAGLSSGGWEVPRRLQISRDGGRSWAEVGGKFWVTDRGSENFGYDTGLVHPADERVGFVSHYRTDDGGRTWAGMAGCDGVFAADASGRLYGADARPDGFDLVMSNDAGQTWRTITPMPGGLEDLSVTPEGDRVFVCADHRLWSVSPDGNAAPQRIATPPTGTGRHRVATVSVDPRDGQTIYIGQRIDVHAADVGVMRSTDGGETWTNLNLTVPLDGTQLDGGREPQCLRVNPHTGDLWVTTGCYGVWRYVAPRE